MKNHINQTIDFECNSLASAYKKILINNYMNHYDMYNIISTLATHFQKQVSLLQLGLSENLLLIQSLSNRNIDLFKGIDISESILNVAHKNMEFLHSDKVFIQGDFFNLVPEWVKKKQDKFDVIIASLNLHHVNLTSKEHFLGLLFHLLKPKGIFLLIETVRRDEESKEQCINRFLESVINDWSLITQQEFLSIKNHMLFKDFPETNQTFEIIAKKNNFDNFECIYQSPKELSQLLVFYK